ncbi:e3 ubiquitin-protein ligase ccnb1ip1 [Tubulinosema ratisbonensis]|uniref:E3 ubiquitin-protein ligase ccnb1ip1 n=1 Tax=Tubulinosema ratisbonensis TaxID=291195 RepID=A0A437AHX6_9MICR|nr:e3 ubiquitin-protein ligase ccnb1ip1 [Tubulinosema ratisbonensis]
MFLKCNNIRRTEIQKLGIITFCSHIFCGICFTKVKKLKSCLACKSYVEDNEYMTKELDKEPCLAGYSPERIFDICRTGISFWTFQMEQECTIEIAMKEKLEDELSKIKTQLKNTLATLTIDNESKVQKIQRLSYALDKERQTNFELTNLIAEKTKEHQKLLNLFEKRKNSLPRMQFDEFNGSDENKKY